LRRIEPAKDGQARSGLKVAAWKVERLGEIGKNKPAEKKAPAESAKAHGNSNGDRRQSGAPAIRNYADDIPFSTEWRG
jgi:hypothetical protein